MLPQKEEARELGRMEFQRFLNTIMLLPCQGVKTARQLVLRLLGYSRWAHVLIDGTEFFRRRRLA